MGVANSKAMALAVLLQLSLLCLLAFGDVVQTVPLPPTDKPHYQEGAPAPAPSHHPHHHHRHPHSHPPAHAPVHPPTRSPPTAPSHPPIQPPKLSPPVHPPMPSPTPVHTPYPPVKPPVHSPRPQPVPRSFVAVQGVVYCKSCKYARAETLLGATPILGAKVKVECNNTKYPLVAQATTDKNGYFFLEAPKKVTSYGAHKCKVSLVSSSLASCSKPTDLHGGVTGGSLRPEKPYVANKSPFVLFTVGPFAFAPTCPL